MLVRDCNKVQAILKFRTKRLMVGIIFKWKVWFNMGCIYELGTAAVTQVLICGKYPRPPSHLKVFILPCDSPLCEWAPL